MATNQEMAFAKAVDEAYDRGRKDGFRRGIAAAVRVIKDLEL